MKSLQARLIFLTSLKRGRGILLTSTGLLSAMLTNLASRIATAHETWTHLPKSKGYSVTSSSKDLWPSHLMEAHQWCFTPTTKFLRPSEVRTTVSAHRICANRPQRTTLGEQKVALLTTLTHSRSVAKWAVNWGWQVSGSENKTESSIQTSFT